MTFGALGIWRYQQSTLNRCFVERNMKMNGRTTNRFDLLERTNFPIHEETNCNRELLKVIFHLHFLFETCWDTSRVRR